MNGLYQFPNVPGVPPTAPYAQQQPMMLGAMYQPQLQFGQMYGATPQYADNGMANPAPQFQNPFGPQQPPNGQRMYSPGPTQPQSVSVGGSPQQSGLPSLLSSNTQNQYPNGYTPIGPKQQNFISG